MRKTRPDPLVSHDCPYFDWLIANQQSTTLASLNGPAAHPTSELPQTSQHLTESQTLRDGEHLTTIPIIPCSSVAPLDDEQQGVHCLYTLVRKAEFMSVQSPSLSTFSTTTLDREILSSPPRGLPLQKPWNVGPQSLPDCAFYHTMDLPGIGTVSGFWDLRETVDQYLGGFDFSGKSVLELGTASGFVAFHMAKQGAKVVGCDLPKGRDFNLIPYAGMGAQRMEELRLGYDHFIDRMKRGFWLARQAYDLPVDVMYLPLHELAAIDQKFDVVVTAQTLVHMMNPIEAFLVLASKARETMIFVERPASHLGDEVPYAMFYPNAKTFLPDGSWWCFSVPLIRQMFQIAGFEIVSETSSRHLCTTMDPKVENPMALMTTFIGKRIHAPVI